MFSLVLRFARAACTLMALGGAAPDGAAQGYRDAWRPRTVPLVGVSYSPDVGLLLGAGVAHTRYGFRALPASTRLVAEAAYATGVRTYRVGVGGEFRRPLAPAILTFELRASGLEIVRFYGLGNESDGSGADSIYLVGQKQVLVAPSVTVPLAPRLRLSVGPLLQYAHTRPEPGTVLETGGPYYGAGDFGQVGAGAALDLDARDAPVAPARGGRVRLAAQWYPALWDAVAPFGGVAIEATTYLSTGDPAAATLALRVAGARVGGSVPFAETVYIGGATTVRGYAEQRFAGRSGAYANAELRLLAGRVSIGDVGLFGLADAGRVWTRGESSDRWHAAAGGGLWFAWQHRRANTVSITAARSQERTAIYFRVGFMF